MIKYQLLSSKHLANLIVVKSINECIEKLMSVNNFPAEDGLDSYYWQ